MLRTRPSEMSCTGYPRRSSTIILSRKASVAEPSLQKQHQRILGGIGRLVESVLAQDPSSTRFGPITWSTPGRKSPKTGVPASNDNPDRRSGVELRVRRFAEAVARLVGECAPCRPTFHGKCLVVLNSSARRWSTLDASCWCDVLRSRSIASIVCRPRRRRLAIACARANQSASAQLLLP
jgi:hypothetical protein